MNKSSTILFPLLRDIKTIPPTVSIINFLADKGHKIILFTYYTDITFDNANISIICLNKKPYPVTFIKRLIAKLYFYRQFYTYFLKNKQMLDVIWMGAWDVLGIDKFKGESKLVYHFHELEPHKFKYCRKSDYVVVPEENRAWITYFEARLNNKPLLLPNIPNYSQHKVTTDQEIKALQENGKIVVLYSGLIDNKKRNLKELVSAFQFLDDNVILTIIPSFVKVRNDIAELKDHIKRLKLEHRILFLDSRIPPKHIDTMATADIGVGFYSAVSLNNVYAAPNRLYEFVNFGTPVVLPDFPTFRALSKEFPFAINIADPNSPENIADSIKGIIKNAAISKNSIFSFKEKEGNYDYFADQVVKEIFK